MVGGLCCAALGRAVHAMAIPFHVYLPAAIASLTDPQSPTYTAKPSNLRSLSLRLFPFPLVLGILRIWRNPDITAILVVTIRAWWGAKKPSRPERRRPFIVLFGFMAVVGLTAAWHARFQTSQGGPVIMARKRSSTPATKRPAPPNIRGVAGLKY